MEFHMVKTQSFSMLGLKDRTGHSLISPSGPGQRSLAIPWSIPQGAHPAYSSGFTQTFLKAHIVILVLHIVLIFKLILKSKNCLVISYLDFWSLNKCETMKNEIH